MEKSRNLIIGVLVLAIIGVAVILFMNNSDDETQTNSNTSSQTETQNQTQENEPQPAQKDIVALAGETENLSTLVTAVKAADLVETLQGEGPFTVFAPTNDAFSALPAGTLDTLLKPENKSQLAGILTYHVVAGKVMSSDLSNGQEVTTVQGNKLTVKIADGKVYLVDAKGAEAQVTTADVEASNGVVHIINAVVMPE